MPGKVGLRLSQKTGRYTEDVDHEVPASKIAKGKLIATYDLKDVKDESLFSLQIKATTFVEGLGKKIPYSQKKILKSELIAVRSGYAEIYLNGNEINLVKYPKK